MPPTDDDVDLDHAYLSARAGTPATLLGPEGEPVLALTLGEPSQERVAGGWASWSVDLVGPADPRLDQSTYRVRFDDGEAWLFLVPVAGDDATTTYQSTFTREAETP
ncbi:hypothetical protein ABFT23_03375 [Nocardioides sp. C4-1]|uniref:DUF6916 family protein n=1 Tax=Nocardioides sp. C4-1 TaxID=3151851 RepID=UPI003265316C